MKITGLQKTLEFVPPCLETQADTIPRFHEFCSQNGTRSVENVEMSRTV
jgi:hypothetical protein